MSLQDIVSELQKSLTDLQAFASSAPQFSQSDLDAALAKGMAQGLAQAATVLGADLAKLTSDVAGLVPAPVVSS